MSSFVEIKIEENDCKDMNIYRFPKLSCIFYESDDFYKKNIRNKLDKLSYDDLDFIENMLSNNTCKFLKKFYEDESFICVAWKLTQLFKIKDILLIIINFVNLIISFYPNYPDYLENINFNIFYLLAFYYKNSNLINIVKNLKNIKHLLSIINIKI